MLEDNRVLGVSLPVSAFPAIDRLARIERSNRSAVARKILLDALDAIKGTKPA